MKNKIKLTLGSALIVLTSSTVFAQDKNVDHRTKLTFGAKIGLNYSNVWDDQGQDFNADPNTV